MIIFLLVIIALLLWLIYMHMTKHDRAKAQFEKYIAKQEREYREQQALKEQVNTIDVEMPKDDLSDQIERYHKVHKTWNWRK